MKKLLPWAEAVVFFSLAIAGAAGAQIPPPPSTSLPSWVTAALPTAAAMQSSIPPPADDPLLDANGNVVYDSSGKPVSDPNESFHQVKPQEFDPYKTELVQAAWLNGTGCPTSTFIFNFNTSQTETYEDPGCPTGDPKDQHIEGLLLVKTGPTANFASATAELKKVRGITLTELGYDIRKSSAHVGPQGSHCGAGAPRFDVVTQDGTTHFVGCATGTEQSTSNDWVRLRWGQADLINPAVTFPPLNPGDVISRMFIVFDEGSDTGPDFFGAAILDNIDVNATIVGHGPTDAD